MRPKHTNLVKFSNRKTCLSQRHQNMVLKLKALKTLGISASENPDTYVELKSDNEILLEIESVQEENIIYSEWKRVEVEKKGRLFKRMQIIPVQKTKSDFITIIRN